MNEETEYVQINENIRFLADVRFKLLTIVATVGGAAVFVLSRIDAAPTAMAADLVLLVAVFGFLATLGITLYDQRNSQLYNALIHRAKHLERKLGVAGTPGALMQLAAGGQFRERPKQRRRFLFPAGHDLALALVYGPLLGAWLFPIVYAAAQLARAPREFAAIAATVAAVAGGVAFTARLIALDRAEIAEYKAAAARDGLTE